MKEQWNRDLLILRDSQSACEDIGNNKLDVRIHEWIVEIKDKIQTYERENGESERIARKVVVGWIPGHAGIIDNERVDRIAKEATERNPEKEKVPCFDWKGINKEETKEKTKKRNEVEGRYKGKLYFVKYKKKRKRESVVP